MLGACSIGKQRILLGSLLGALMSSTVGLGCGADKVILAEGTGGGSQGGCAAGQTACGAACVDINTDFSNCGSCGKACGPGQVCSAGVCSCGGGLSACATGCADVTADEANCGACGTACHVGQLCEAGQCECQSGLTACSGACVDVMSDGANCGSCGNACTGTQVCSLGQCAAGCAAGLEKCGNSCVDLSTSAQHCGACDAACSAGQSCTEGSCGCPSGQTACSGVCATLATDPQNCGACGTVCTGGQTCSNGACGCPSGQELCGGSCVDTATDEANCGSCGLRCSAGQICTQGSCTGGSSNTGGATGTGGTSSTGGRTSTGGTSSTGGRSTGGTNTGGSSTGGSSTGGSSGNVTLPPIEGGTDGWATRYWDCCKPHCAWSGNVNPPLSSCNQQNQSVGASDQASACDGGGDFMCWSFAPWSVSDTVSYGFAAMAGGVCGRCYQLQFTGASHGGSGASAVSGKQMIVQIINVGGLQQNQFDLLIPGGGVGDFNACSTQWGTSDLGAQYGGFLLGCNGDTSCVRQMCDDVFSGKPELMAGCDWFLGWFGAADNPALVYQQVDCPSAITSKSGLR